MLIALDMTKRTSRFPLDEYFGQVGDEPRLEVLALRDPELQYEIDRNDRVVRAGQTLDVRFPDHPYVRLQFAVSRTADRLSLEIRPQMALGSDRPVPFTLASIGKARRDARRRAGTMDAQLSQAKQEKENLDTWLRTRSPKTLQARRDAQTRVVVLGKQIPDMESAVEAAKRDADAIDAMERLANRLHDNAMIQVDLVDPDAR